MKITLGTLKDKGDDLVAFLEPRVGTKPSLSGGTIDIADDGVREGVKPRSVKTYIKRFLYMNGIRKNYRVFVAGKELTVQEIELGEEEEEEEKPAKKEEEAREEEKEEPKEEEKEEEAEKEEEPEEKEESEKEESEEPAKAEEAEEKPKKAAKKPRATKKKKQAEEA